MNPSVDRASANAVADALDALLARRADLGECIAAIRRLMAEDVHLADILQAHVERAHREGLLPSADHARLTEAINESYSEDVPTEWSEEVALACTRDAARDDGAPMPGSRLRDRFVLVARIGSGGMADIYKALDLRKQEAGVEDPVVAVKILRAEFRDRPAARQAFETEAALAASLAHPNIVRVFDSDRDGEHVFMTLELLEGRSLAALMNERGSKPLDGAAARRFAQCMARALAYAQATGIVHADIKPGNVFVTDKGQVKLLDFGCARTATADAGAASEPAAPAGGHTPAYASCEVLEGLVPAPRDDLYSLACVIYRMLCGRRPWGAASALEAEQSARDLVRSRGIADHEWEALRAALAFRRENRPASVADFLGQFLGESRDTATPSAPVNSAAQAETFSRPNRWLPMGLAAVVIAIAIGVAATVPAPTPDLVAPMAARTAMQADPALAGPTAVPPATRLPGAVGPPLALVEPAGAMTEGSTRTSPREPAIELEKIMLPEFVKRRSEKAIPGLPGSAAALASSRLPVDVPIFAAPDSIPRYMKLVPDGSPADARLSGTAASEATAADTDAVDEPVAWPADDLLLAFNGSAAQAAASLGAFARPIMTRNATEPVAVIPFARPLTSGAPPDTAADVPITVEGPVQRPLSALEFDRYVEPRFPRRAGRSETSGWVVVQFRVDRRGTVQDLQIIDADPPLFFDQAAIGAVEQWRFKPLIEAGEAVESLSMVRLRFQPQE